MSKVVIPIKLSNWNEIINQNRINKYVGASHKKQEMNDISWYIRKIPPIKEYPIQITFTWHIKNVRADLDNKSVKSILDCMQNLGILENDNIKHIRKITHIAMPDKEEYIEMEIMEG
jgi:Holliday junction resolvase RusA-like endonuclease